MFLMDIAHGDKDEKKFKNQTETHAQDRYQGKSKDFLFGAFIYIFGTALTCVILVPSSCSALNSCRVACRVDSMLH